MSQVQFVGFGLPSAIPSSGFSSNEIPAGLPEHLRQRLGVWPPSRSLEAIIWPGRDLPEWDGGHWPLLGLTTPFGSVLSISPELGTLSEQLDADQLAAALSSSDPEAFGSLLGHPALRLDSAVFRWSGAPTAGPDAGEWMATTDERLPAWLKPFGGESLVLWGESGEVAGAVGLKRHDRFGQELSVAVEPEHRGRGIARALVAQAARRILSQGGVPIYLHEASNVASARVADAAGFPDRGWRLIWLSPACPDPIPDRPDHQSYRTHALMEEFQS